MSDKDELHKEIDRVVTLAIHLQFAAEKKKAAKEILDLAHQKASTDLTVHDVVQDLGPAIQIDQQFLDQAMQYFYPSQAELRANYEDLNVGKSTEYYRAWMFRHTSSLCDVLFSGLKMLYPEAGVTNDPVEQLTWRIGKFERLPARRTKFLFINLKPKAEDYQVIDVVVKISCLPQQKLVSAVINDPRLALLCKDQLKDYVNTMASENIKVIITSDRHIT